MSEQLQQAQLDKEALRIQKKREANEARAKRFLDARQRSIGVDVAALDAQVAEKRRNQQNNDDSDRLERIRAKEIDRILEAAAVDEVNMRKFQMEELKKEWEDKSSELRARRAVKPADYYPEKFGPSSFQVFDGEDTLAEERERMKKDQVRRWTQEQVAERAVQRQREKEEDMYNAEMIRQIDLMREQAEEQEINMHKMLRREVADSNKELAEMQGNRKMQKKYSEVFDESGNPLTTSMPLSVSNNNFTNDGKVVRKDTFRGYTPAQCRKLLQENELLREIKRQQKEDEEASDREWAKAQMSQLRAMELAQYEEDQLKKYQREVCAKSLKEQVLSQEERRKKSQSDYRGAISPEFFGNFGRSCR